MSVLTDTTQLGLPSGTWSLDPVHSAIGFELPYLAGTFRGQFKDVDARLTDEGLTGSARVASVDVKDENLAAHLQSPDFFDAERHPELRFTADDAALDGATVTVQGEITIKGVTKPIELSGAVTPPVADPYGNERIAIKLSTIVDRTEFGINWNVPLPTGQPALANEVRIIADLYFVKAD